MVAKEVLWKKPKEVSTIVDGRKRNWKTITTFFDGDKHWELKHERYEIQKYTGPLPRVPFRVMLIHNNFGIASGNNLTELINKCWIYLTETMPKLIPELATEDEISNWIVQHISELESSLSSALKRASSHRISALTESSSFSNVSLSNSHTIGMEDKSMKELEEQSSEDELDDSSEIENTGIELKAIHSSNEGDNNNNSNNENNIILRESLTSSSSSSSLSPSLKPKHEITSVNSISSATTTTTTSSLPSVIVTEITKSNNKEETMSPATSKLFSRMKAKWNSNSNSKHETGQGQSHSNGQSQSLPSSPLPEHIQKVKKELKEKEMEKTLIISSILFFRSLFDEDAPKRKRTLRYTLLLCICMTVYSIALRYASFDLFIVLLLILYAGVSHLITERRKFIVLLAKRKAKRLAREKKKQWFGWMFNKDKDHKDKDHKDKDKDHKEKEKENKDKDKDRDGRDDVKEKLNDSDYSE